MKNTDLLKAMNGIDERFLLEADPYQKKVRRSFAFKRSWKLVSAFAVLLLAVGIFYPLYSRPVYNNFTSDSAPAIAYDSKEEKAAEEESMVELFAQLPETIAGSRLSESYIRDEHSSAASYCDGEGKETFLVLRQDIPFTYPSVMPASDNGREMQDALPHTTVIENSDGCSVYWQEDGFYYCLEIRGSENCNAEIIAEAVSSIR
ncbi:MAG: hypothetical protein Q4F09_04140 [Erysipelotrichaceae bacterium]|nr:hypothetical protein [Erysipelotrichaceae bacterium]